MTRKPLMPNERREWWPFAGLAVSPVAGWVALEFASEWLHMDGVITVLMITCAAMGYFVMAIAERTEARGLIPNPLRSILALIIALGLPMGLLWLLEILY